MSVLATVPSACLLGAKGRPVAVEVHVSRGLPGFTIVGLPDAVCRESRDRVRAALLSCGLAWPTRRVTVNLAPSDMPKVGAALDLPIAIALLAAAGELRPGAIEGLGFLGGLGLDRMLRPFSRVVPLAAALPGPVAVVPPECAAEASLVRRLEVRSVPNLATLLSVLRDDAPWPAEPAPAPVGCPTQQLDLADVRGHPVGRLALEVAAAGLHHLLLVGPPGSGKTMLARRLPGLLPPLSDEDALESNCIRSAAGLPPPDDGFDRPPLRAPHHGVSAVAMTGGGTAALRPGEISLAHAGVLFLDELGEFRTDVLDQLREPLEDGVVRVSRARASVTFPARFLLVAAMNPCPCGGDGPAGWCRCSEASRARYGRRLSGPLLDRFDLRVTISRPDPADLDVGNAWRVQRRRSRARRHRAGGGGTTRRAGQRPSSTPPRSTRWPRYRRPPPCCSSTRCGRDPSAPAGSIAFEGSPARWLT